MIFIVGSMEYKRAMMMRSQESHFHSVLFGGSNSFASCILLLLDGII